MSTQKVMGGLEWAMLVALSVLWGGSFFFNAIAVKELPPFTFVLLRVGIGSLVLLALLRFMGFRMPRDWKVWLQFAGMGILNNIIPFCLIVWSEKRLSGGLASVLSASTPLFAVIMAHFLTSDEKATPNKIIGVIIGFVGVAILIGTQVLTAAGSDVWAEIAVLGAAVSYASAGIFGRRFKEMGLQPFVTATGQISSSTLMLIPLALIFDQPWNLPMPGQATWAAVAGISLLSTSLGFVLFFRILATAGATNLMLVSFLIPASAILLGFIFLGEHLAVNHVIGMLTIGLGLISIDGRLVARASSRVPV
ncbi:DMT family transporter [Undibacterium sp. JH2W]|uniref:DMT family transporter n=1 Tax=Undibacterium sp. JH2W TaxID=3413037 RepID=UPI003BF229D3